ncbi:UPF0302 protein [Compostibacillus humi]|uniref:UPF0302 protein GCM10010978_02130 n=1 Tax=Compostibacillus humi TaxID=1245525 RepID=A0A8J2ZNU9_9BACI|nr:ReoY family proteolytic degradation factor [Compostibacillus humi]GGH68789.1 UPF0302 protein [Compostibacillus humi]
MSTSVSVEDKKRFIQWFLKNYQLKKRESAWILHYILNHAEILENIHFVRDVKFCPRGMMITSKCSEEVPFRFYKNHLVTTDVEKTFHDIRLNYNEKLYIQINFFRSNQNAKYALVLEENPFLPDDYHITRKDRHLAGKILDYSIYHFERDRLLKEIDTALDEMDEERFFHLTEQLHQLDREFQQPRLQKQ